MTPHSERYNFNYASSHSSPRIRTWAPKAWHLEVPVLSKHTRNAAVLRNVEGDGSVRLSRAGTSSTHLKASPADGADEDASQSLAHRKMRRVCQMISFDIM